jgi:hypothetical protein
MILEGENRASDRGRALMPNWLLLKLEFAAAVQDSQRDWRRASRS